VIWRPFEVRIMRVLRALAARGHSLPEVTRSFQAHAIKQSLGDFSTRRHEEAAYTGTLMTEGEQSEVTRAHYAETC